MSTPESYSYDFLSYFRREDVMIFHAFLRFAYQPNDFQAFELVAAKYCHLACPQVADIFIETRKKAFDHPLGLFDLLSIAGDNFLPEDAKEAWTKLLLSFVKTRNAMCIGQPRYAVQATYDGWFCEYISEKYPDKEKRLRELELLLTLSSAACTMDDYLILLGILQSAAFGNDFADLERHGL